MIINDKDAGAPFKILSPGGARGVAAGTGDNTEAVGEIVDMEAQPGPMSGFVFVAGSAALTDLKSISLLDVKVEHGDDSALGDKADYITPVDFADLKVSDGGTTELFAVKVKVDLTGIKRYWRVAVTPDLDHTSTDLFQLGFGFAAICDESPQA